MTQRNNPYLQNRFEENDEPGTMAASRRASRRPPTAQRMKEMLMTKFAANPIMAACALMFAGAAFATIIITAYPDGRDDSNVPIIQADAQPFREMTTETASADKNQDSTIYSTLRSGQMNETAPIENLLDQEEPVERAQPAQPTQATNTAAEPTTQKMANAEPAAGTIVPSDPSTKVAVTATLPDETPAGTTTTASAAPLEHAAGESPDTLEFVRSVLDKKDGKNITDATATQATAGPSFSDVAPASGGNTFAPGTYYVQLGSVTSRTGADSEFKKMQKNFAGSGLESASYRVQEATVADKGTFYRIQAGPMSKESAGKLCDSIKTQSPGGCLIVQQ